MNGVIVVQIVTQVVTLVICTVFFGIQIANANRQPVPTSYRDHGERSIEHSGEGSSDTGNSDAEAGTLHRDGNVPTLEELQAGDRDIDQERCREIEREAETHDHPLQQRIRHFSHPDHELEELRVSSSINCSSTLHCHSCRNDITVGQAYQCSSNSRTCNFALHGVCAQDPVSFSVCMPCVAQEMKSRGTAGGWGTSSTRITTFAHVHDVVKTFSNDEGICKHCNSEVIGERFKCCSCSIDLHPVCARNPTRLFSFMHPQHQLELKTKPESKTCTICRRNASHRFCRVYACDRCEFYVHPACSQLPLYLLHELHPERHPLQLRLMPDGSRCDAKCGKRCQSWRYHCSSCEVSFHVECILNHSINKQIPQYPSLSQRLERENPASGRQHSDPASGRPSTGWNIEDLQKLIQLITSAVAGAFHPVNQ